MTGAVRAGFTFSWRVIYLSTLLMFSIALSACDPGAPTLVPTSIPGPIKIKISNPRIKAAIVNLVGTDYNDTLDQDGLTLPYCADNQYISVWVPNYAIGIIDCNGNPIFEYSIELKPLDIADNLNYNLIGANVCRDCHSQGRTEYLEWNKDGHSRVFVDPYFWTMYMGMDIYRNSKAPGFRLDNPGENGNCANCHAPAVVNALRQGMDLSIWNNNLPGSPINVETEGVTCDVCHKVIDVLLGDDLLPFVDHPGVYSLTFARPYPGQLLSTGPSADHKPENSQIITTCALVFSQSRFCAACHYGKFFDTVIYNSYGEWLQSPYSQKENADYRSCQDCHMLSPEQIGQTLPSERAACSGENRSFRDFSHNMMKRDNNDIPTLVQDAAVINMTATKADGKIIVTVAVTNTRAGHKFPTDSPLRHLILLVAARDENDTLLAQVEGPVIPAWGGVGGRPEEDYAGRAGVIYANLLKDKDTNISPTAAYWNPTLPAWPGSDTRLMPGQAMSSVYSFVAPSNGSVTVTARLIYRYAFIDIIRQKGWPVKDILVTSAAAIVP